MRRVVASMVVALVGAGTMTAQGRPDFSGTWIASKEAPSGVPAAPTAVFGPRVSLQHRGDRLTIVRQVRETEIVATFPIDGTEVRTRTPGGVCQGDAGAIERIAWEGNALAFTVVASMPAGSATPVKSGVKRLLHLQSPDMLVVRATLRDPANGEMREVGTIYRRSSDPARSTAPIATPSVTRASLAQVAWISGGWSGTAGSVAVEERWTPPAGGSMLATARTLRGGSLASFEFLCIAERHGGLVYTAMPNGRTPATDFTLTSITSESATFENPAHDFPKMIRYTRRADGSLETTVGGTAQEPLETVVLKRVRD